MLYPVPEIIIGHDPGSSFWFCLAKCHNKSYIQWEDVELSQNELSIEEGDVEDLLYYFLKKYYDKELVYNCRQAEDGTFPHERRCRPAVFEWYLEHNFYTKTTVRTMLDDISNVSNALTRFDEARIPDELLNSKCAYFADAESAETAAAFYRRFVRLMTNMLDENPEWPLLSVMGP